MNKEPRITRLIRLGEAMERRAEFATARGDIGLAERCANRFMAIWRAGNAEADRNLSKFAH